MKGQTMRKTCCIAVWIVCLVSGFGMGCQPAPPFSVQVQMLEPSLLKSVQFLDIALFHADKIKCDAIDFRNYSATTGSVQEARLKSPQHDFSIVALTIATDEHTADAKGAKIERWISRLGSAEELATHPNGLKVHMYMLALTRDTSSAQGGPQKKPIAEGCTTFLLKPGATVDVLLTLGEVKP